MKNRIFFLLGVATLFSVTSCSNSQKGQYTQEQLDSIMQVKEDSMAQSMKLQNDSLINARANARADSIVNSQVKSTPGATKKSSSKSSSGSTSSTKGNTGSSSSNAGAGSVSTNKTEHVRTPAEIDADKKAARFGNAAAKARLKSDDSLVKAARFGDAKAKAILEKRDEAKKSARFNKN